MHVHVAFSLEDASIDFANMPTSFSRPAALSAFTVGTTRPGLNAATSSCSSE